jgi:hypothetical protein
MVYTPVRFRRSEITRAVRAVTDAGCAVDHVVVTTDGAIEVYPRGRTAFVMKEHRSLKDPHAPAPPTAVKATAAPGDPNA